MLKKWTILITGAEGFVGRRLTERYLEGGHRVLGLDLNPLSLEHPNLVPLTADISDAKAVNRVFEAHQPIDRVIHTAALVDDFGEIDLFRRINVGGTLHLLQAARSVGVGRFVHISSIVVSGDEPGLDSDEESPMTPVGAPYTDTKIEAEALARQFMRSAEMEVTVVRPGDVYGPRCMPWVIRPLKLMRDEQFILVAKGLGLYANTYVDNLVDGIQLAAEVEQAAGRVYIITDGHPTTFRSYFSMLARAAKIEAPKRSIPRSLALVVGGLFEIGACLSGAKPPFSRAAIRLISRQSSYSITRARRELGYRPRVELVQGMAHVASWLDEIGGLSAID